MSNAMNENVEKSKLSFLAIPIVGNVFSVLSGLSFLFLCMILPLVGPAAVHGSGSPGAGPAEHLTKNYIFFGSMLALSLLLGVLALVSKVERRKVDGSPLPYYTIILVAILVFILVAFAFGWLAL